MGKKLELSFPGGFPFTQDMLDWVQQHVDEVLRGYGQMGKNGDDAPVILFGLEQTGTAITAGAIYHNGEILFVAAADPGMAPGPGYQWGFVVVNTLREVNYKNGSTQDSQIVRTAAWQGVPTSPEPTDENEYLYLNDMVLWGEAMGARHRTDWEELEVTVATGDITGSLFYKKDKLTNTLLLRGQLESTAPSEFAALPSITLYTMETLPEGYRPQQRTPIVVHNYQSVKALDHTGVQYITHLPAVVGADGVIAIGWIKPDAAYTAYAVELNVSVPLD